jgi:hypothetical protein
MVLTIVTRFDANTSGEMMAFAIPVSSSTLRNDRPDLLVQEK